MRRDDIVSKLAMMHTCLNAFECNHRFCALILEARQIIGEPSEHEKLREELRKRRACLVAARDDLDAIQFASVQDGGVWIRAVASARVSLLNEAIESTDLALSWGAS